MDEQNNSVLKHRQVKHFGYAFRYDTNNVDVDKPLVDNEIPEKCQFLWEKLKKQQINEVSIEPPQQLTVNKYDPGQGNRQKKFHFISVNIEKHSLLQEFPHTLTHIAHLLIRSFHCLWPAM